MSKNSIEVITIECPNKEKVPHKECTKDNPVLIGVGEIVLVPRIYSTSTRESFRDVGLKISPIILCTECWNEMNIPEYIKGIAADSASKLALGSRYDTPSFHSSDNPIFYPTVKHEVGCMNVEHMGFHRGDAIGVTNDVCVRGLFKFQPMHYMQYVDYKTYQFEVEIDSCMSCLPDVWKYTKDARIDRIYAKLIGHDITVNPDFAATLSMFNAVTGGRRV